MHALDDVGWDYGFSFASYGAKLGVRSTDNAVLRTLFGQLPFDSMPTNAPKVDRMFSVLSTEDRTSGQVTFNLYCDHLLYSQKLSLDDLVNSFQGIASIAIAELSTNKLFIHSGVVGWHENAILLPGKSHSGKSTLVAELVKLGASFYSDEFALIDNDGFVSPYAKPLSLRDPQTQQQYDVSIAGLGGKQGVQKLPVGLIAFSTFQENAAWKPDEISPGIGLLHLLEYTHSAQRDPDRAMRLIKKAIINARVIMGLRGEAEQTALKILNEIPNST